MKKFLFAILCMLSTVPAVSAAEKPVTQVCFIEKCVNVEIADDDASRMRGLQGRLTMDPNSGMLFVFPKSDMYNFWMKDTLIPLDMIWLDADQRVVDIKSGVPPCQENPCPIYAPSGEAVYVLEIAAGIAETFGIQRGEKAEFK